MRSFDEFIQHLSAVGFRPATVIDVGVAWGTPPLYSGFPNAYFILVEALPYFEPHLKNILRTVAGEYHLKAVSNEPGTITLHVKEDVMSLAGASIRYPRTDGTLAYEIEVERLDKLLAETPLRGPVLLKTDVQNVDLEALMGAEGLLPNVEVVIAEANVVGEVNLVLDIANYMKSQGFCLYDIVGGLNRPYDNALGQVDLAFVRETSALRAHPGWA